MAGRPYVLAETNWKTVRETEYEVAILPWGATEAHNFHLPYGTDTGEAEAVATEAARLAWEEGATCLVLPSVPFGANAPLANRALRKSAAGQRTVSSKIGSLIR